MRILREYRAIFAALVLLIPGIPTALVAQYLVIFDEDDTLGADYRDASFGFSESGDFVRLSGPTANKLPVQTGPAYSGASSGILEYRHAAGRWEVFVASPGWRARDLTAMDTLLLFVNGPDSIPNAELPRIGLEDTDNQKTDLIELSTWLDGLDADSTTWQRIAVPIDAIQPVGSFNRASTKTVRFTDSAANPSTRILWIDLVVAISAGTPPPSGPPDELETRDGDESVILRWKQPEGALGHHVYRQKGAEEMLTRITDALVAGDAYVDFEVANGDDYHYFVEAFGPAGQSSGLSEEVSAAPRELTDDEFLDLVARTAFDYFWYEANPQNGLVKDRSTETSNSSIAAVGFGLTAIPIGIDNGWIDRQAGLERVLATLEFFWSSPHGPEPDATGYKGFYYHFLDMQTGRRAGTTELSTIDTALLLAGVLFAKSYFDGESESEERVRMLADSIWMRVDWPWASPRPPRVGHGWRPESGFIQFDWGGYNEAMILYVLALGSPTYPIPTTAWTAWTSGYQWETYYGYSFVRFPPLFGHQYTHAWVDFRGIQDAYMRGRGIDYFENSRRATLANRAYCAANPMGWPGYSSEVWGLTASDGPNGYRARGAPPAQNDDGTITPTAAASSITFTTDESIAAMRAFYDNFRTRLWGKYGFKDAFNLQADWFGTDYLGIDQGPILLMIENHRNEAVWSRFMTNQDVLTGLERAGFQPFGTAAEELPDRQHELSPASAFPNPFSLFAELRFELAEAGDVDVTIYDALGRRVAVADRSWRQAGEHILRIDGSDLPAGVYHYVVTSGDHRQSGQIVRSR